MVRSFAYLYQLFAKVSGRKLSFKDLDANNQLVFLFCFAFLLADVYYLFYHFAKPTFCQNQDLFSRSNIKIKIKQMVSFDIINASGMLKVEVFARIINH